MHHIKNVINTVEGYLGRALPEKEKQILQDCGQSVRFVRLMSPVINQTARLNASCGQLIIEMCKEGNIRSVVREPTKQKYFKCALRPVKKDNSKTIIVINNLDVEHKTPCGIWVWEYSV